MRRGELVARGCVTGSGGMGSDLYYAGIESVPKGPSWCPSSCVLWHHRPVGSMFPGSPWSPIAGSAVVRSSCQEWIVNKASILPTEAVDGGSGYLTLFSVDGAPRGHPTFICGVVPGWATWSESGCPQGYVIWASVVSGSEASPHCGQVYCVVCSCGRAGPGYQELGLLDNTKYGNGSWVPNEVAFLF